MKYCDTCRTAYPTEFNVCPRDRSVLRVTSELIQGMVIRDKYRIEEKIGAGGMATVYRARHLAFNEERALKLVSTQLAEDETLLKRFRTEAVVTRKLQHPNAVRVDDLDTTEDGRPFIVMEFVRGKNLRQVIEQEGPLPMARALHIARQVVSALDAAHCLGITHRDIKPDNILLVPHADGQDVVEVLDFGIAKVREGAMDVGAGYTTTKTGMVVGTPQYISPEQAMGKHGDQIDGRADLYSLGVVVYEMLTGQLPFESDTPMGMLLHHIQTEPRPPHRIRPDLNIPESLSMLLMKALEKDRQRRFQTAADMLEALTQPDQWAATKPSVPAPPSAAAPARAPAVSPPSPPSPRDRGRAPAKESAGRRRKWPVAATLILLAGLGLSATYYFYLQQKLAPVAQPVAAPSQTDVDRRILFHVQSALATSKTNKNVVVTVRDGVVTLSGTVPSQENVELARRLATGFVGIKEIRSQITVAEPVEKAPATGPAALPPPRTEKAAGPAPARRAPPAEPSATELKGAPARVKERKEKVPGARPKRENSREALGKEGSGASGPAMFAPEDVPDLLAKADDYAGRGDYSKAIFLYQEILRLDPQNARAREGLQRAKQAREIRR